MDSHNHTAPADAVVAAMAVAVWIFFALPEIVRAVAVLIAL